MTFLSAIGMAALMLLPFQNTNRKIKNAKTETVKVYGNCDMCKQTIEKAGTLKNVANVAWDENTQEAVLTYDPQKTNKEQILKKIALAGYDNEQFLAPDDVYARLESCCQYERKQKGMLIASTAQPGANPHEGHAGYGEGDVRGEDGLTRVFDAYFGVKDALVKTDGAEAASAATKLLNAIKTVKMDKLDQKTHKAWMEVVKDLTFDTEHIMETKDAEHQRSHFMTLSKRMYTVLKTAGTASPVYYQFCPMADGGKGANWLSRESAVKNPYYGSKMLTCGKTAEVIK